VIFEHRGSGFLHLEEERVVGIPALEQNDRAPGADAAHTDHFDRTVDGGVALEQHGQVIGYRFAIPLQLGAHDLSRLGLVRHIR
jgi:hypothetical protein